MTANEYQREAMRTLNPALDQQAVLLNGVMGLCGESGEAINIVKKHLAQGHPLDREALVRELGDVAWYLAETAAKAPSAWSADARAWAESKGIVQGNDAGQKKYRASVTREELVQMLYRALQG